MEGANGDGGSSMISHYTLRLVMVAPWAGSYLIGGATRQNGLSLLPIMRLWKCVIKRMGSWLMWGHKLRTLLFWQSLEVVKDGWVSMRTRRLHLKIHPQALKL